MKTKRYLLEILERTGSYSWAVLNLHKDMGEVYNMLQKGSERARSCRSDLI